MPEVIRILTFAILLIPPAVLQAESFAYEYLAYTSGHMDIGFRLDGENLEGYWKNDSADVDGLITDFNLLEFSSHEVRALAVFDDATAPFIRPAGSHWDFIGVDEGDPFYYLPSGGVPTTLPDLGFSTEHLSVNGFEDALFRITLVDMVGPPDAVFSLFTSSSNILMNTLSGADHLELEVGDHQHYVWVFSKVGTYDLTFLFEIIDEDGEEETVLHAGQSTFRFQITDGGGYDDYAHWRRTHFRPEQIEDDSVSGPNADAGAAVGETRGYTNFERYTFSGPPTIGMEPDAVEPKDLLIFLTLRTDIGDYNVATETTTDLRADTWGQGGLQLIDTERVFHDPGLERRTYRITHADDGPFFIRASATLIAP